MTAAIARSAGPTIRAAVPGDVPFVSSTWKQQFKFESSWANRIRWPIFSAGHGRVIVRLLQRSSVLVACGSDPDEIFGYVVYESEPALLHFAYTKPAFRRAGLFHSLLAQTGFPADLAGVEVTHGTRAWFGRPELKDKTTGRVLRPAQPGLEDRFPGATYNPYHWIGLD